MASRTAPARTRSRLALPDEPTLLSRSPLRTAKSANRTKTIKSVDGLDLQTGEPSEDGTSESAPKSGKRSASPPPTDEYKAGAGASDDGRELKRPRREDDPTRLSDEENLALPDDGSADHPDAASRPAPEHNTLNRVLQSNAQKPVSTIDVSHPPTAHSFDRARSVPLFPAPAPSIPHIDFTQPAFSPARPRARSRSPTKELSLRLMPGDPLKAPRMELARSTVERAATLQADMLAMADSGPSEPPPPSSTPDVLDTPDDMDTPSPEDAPVQPASLASDPPAIPIPISSAMPPPAAPAEPTALSAQEPPPFPVPAPPATPQAPPRAEAVPGSPLTPVPPTPMPALMTRHALQTTRHVLQTTYHDFQEDVLMEEADESSLSSLTSHSSHASLSSLSDLSSHASDPSRPSNPSQPSRPSDPSHPSLPSNPSQPSLSSLPSNSRLPRPGPSKAAVPTRPKAAAKTTKTAAAGRSKSSAAASKPTATGRTGAAAKSAAAASKLAATSKAVTSKPVAATKSNTEASTSNAAGASTSNAAASTSNAAGASKSNAAASTSNAAGASTSNPAAAPKPNAFTTLMANAAAKGKGKAAESKGKGKATESKGKAEGKSKAAEGKGKTMAAEGKGKAMEGKSRAMESKSKASEAKGKGKMEDSKGKMQSTDAGSSKPGPSRPTTPGLSRPTTPGPSRPVTPGSNPGLADRPKSAMADSSAAASSKRTALKSRAPSAAPDGRNPADARKSRAPSAAPKSRAPSAVPKSRAPSAAPRSRAPSAAPSEGFSWTPDKGKQRESSVASDKSRQSGHGGTKQSVKAKMRPREKPKLVSHFIFPDDEDVPLNDVDVPLNDVDVPLNDVHDHPDDAHVPLNDVDDHLNDMGAGKAGPSTKAGRAGASTATARARSSSRQPSWSRKPPSISKQPSVASMNVDTAITLNDGGNVEVAPRPSFELIPPAQFQFDALPAVNRRPDHSLPRGEATNDDIIMQDDTQGDSGQPPDSAMAICAPSSTDMDVSPPLHLDDVPLQSTAARDPTTESEVASTSILTNVLAESPDAMEHGEDPIAKAAALTAMTEPRPATNGTSPAEGEDATDRGRTRQKIQPARSRAPSKAPTRVTRSVSVHRLDDPSADVTPGTRGRETTRTRATSRVRPPSQAQDTRQSRATSRTRPVADRAPSRTSLRSRSTSRAAPRTPKPATKASALEASHAGSSREDEKSDMETSDLSELPDDDMDMDEDANVVHVSKSQAAVTIHKQLRRPPSKAGQAFLAKGTAPPSSKDATTSTKAPQARIAPSSSPAKAAPSPTKRVSTLTQPTAASVAKMTPKTPTKSTTVLIKKTPSPNKRARSNSMVRQSSSFSFRHGVRESLGILERALERVDKPAPSRPSTSMGFASDDTPSTSTTASMMNAPMTDLGPRGLKRSISADSEASLSKRPSFDRPDPNAVAGPSRPKLTQKPLAFFRRPGGAGPFGHRAPKASRQPTLQTVAGSPVKGGAPPNYDEEPMPQAGPSFLPSLQQPSEEHNDDDIEFVVTPEVVNEDAELAELIERNRAKDEAALMKPRVDPSAIRLEARRASSAFSALSQSLSELPPKRKPGDMGPPKTPPRLGTRGGLRSASSTYPSSGDSGKGGETESAKGKEKEAPEPKLDVLKGCVVFVDVRTDDGNEYQDVFKLNLKRLGARVLSRLSSSCTHIVYKNGLPNTAMKFRMMDPRPKVVGIRWAVECVERRQRVDEEGHLIDLEHVHVAGHLGKPKPARRRSLIPQLSRRESEDMDLDLDIDMDGGDADVSMQSMSSITSDEDNLTPLERARLRRKMREKA